MTTPSSAPTSTVRRAADVRSFRAAVPGEEPQWFADEVRATVRALR